MKIVEFLRQQGSLLAFVVPGEGVESGKCYPYDVLDILSGRGMWLAVSNIVTYRGLRVNCERASSWCTSPMHSASLEGRFDIFGINSFSPPG
jgi:hypothetical protein